ASLTTATRHHYLLHRQWPPFLLFLPLVVVDAPPPCRCRYAIVVCATTVIGL
ncbi:hypothetical protein U1Q18_039338, partial [Sarracenia purpurea var. burkii]